MRRVYASEGPKESGVRQAGRKELERRVVAIAVVSVRLALTWHFSCICLTHSDTKIMSHPMDLFFSMKSRLFSNQRRPGTHFLSSLCPMLWKRGVIYRFAAGLDQYQLPPAMSTTAPRQ